jgi:hypothetical protein
VLCVTALQHIPEARLSTVLFGFAQALRPKGILHVDVRIGHEPGYDPDLRFIQEFPNCDRVINLASSAGFEPLQQRTFKTQPGANTFQRPIGFQFVELWFRKRAE